MPRLTVALLPLLAVACFSSKDDDSAAPDSGGGVDCSTMAVASVRAFVQDVDGAALSASDLSVRYSVDGSAPADCEAWPDAPDFVCGWEQPGGFLIQASAAGYEDTEVAVDVVMDEFGCHPVTQLVDLPMTPASSGDPE